MPKVLVGMSGGVDSSVAAYLLKEQGYEVEGLSFILWEAKSRNDLITCCSLESMEQVTKTANQIGISHSTIDARDDFTEKVIEPFIFAYTTGSTPNPCILCNRHIKFPYLLKEAEKRHAEYIATGHYARIEKIKNPATGNQHSENEKCLLKKGADPRKDQSYVLYILKQDELRRLILPLGNHKKDEVRKIALNLTLAASDRAESQEICFIEGRNYFKFIERVSPVIGSPGPIVDMNGKVIGTHKGIHGYTIGQRKGLGISSPEPYYVVQIDALKNTVHVGSQQDAKRREFFVEDLNWIFSKGELSFKASIKVRSMMKEEPATVFQVTDNTVQVVFDEPQWAPASGQSAVFYEEDTVIGGGIIRIRD